MSEYEIKVNEDIKEKPDEVLIDQASLDSFIGSNTVFEKARSIIQKNCKCEFVRIDQYKYEIEMISNFFNIRTIGELDRLVNSDTKIYLNFVDSITQRISAKSLKYSLPLFHFFHFLAVKTESMDYIRMYYKVGSIDETNDAPRNLLDLYYKVKKNTIES